jgi:hypothetical protein
MKRFKVNFYFNSYAVNPFLQPSRTVEVTMSESSSENEIILEALKIVGTYPRTYSAQVIEVK